MQRLGDFDVSRHYQRPAARVAAQIVFGLACALAMIASNILVDIRVREASPFALVYPGVVLATLYGHWRGGLTAGLVTFLYAWYFKVPEPHSFAFADATGSARVALSLVSVGIVLLLAETFRALLVAAVEQRDDEIERRTMLMVELEHRTKNNFALVASMLELQRRNAPDPRVGEALALAAARVHSFARAYAHLGVGHWRGSVAMKPYLLDMLSRLTEGAFSERVRVSLRLADCRLERDVAVAIALFANEALANCIKYAFPDDRAGRVEVSFSGDGRHWELVVADDGVGGGAGRSELERPVGTGLNSGLGTKLMSAFATRAGARFEIDDRGPGRVVRLVAEAEGAGRARRGPVATVKTPACYAK